MLKQLYVALLLSLSLLGCSPRSMPLVLEEPVVEIAQKEQTLPMPCIPQESPKIKMALLPIFDATEGELPWNIAQEFSDYVSYHPLGQHVSFIPPAEIALALKERLAEGSKEAGFFDPEPKVATNFCNSDYVLALELVEHAVYPLEPETLPVEFMIEGLRVKSVLKMTVRMRLIDTRHEYPRIMLQEIFTCNHVLPEGGSALDYNRLWWSKHFNSSEWALGHARFFADLVKRLDALMLNL